MLLLVYYVDIIKAKVREYLYGASFSFKTTARFVLWITPSEQTYFLLRNEYLKIFKLYNFFI